MADGSLPETGFFDKHRDKITFAGPSECWLWNAGTNGAGYGWVKARKKMRLAHREAYEAENGAASADGLIVRHRCDTPRCVNPAHLMIGTMADNTRDMMDRGRHKCPGFKGEAHGRSKLTEADVRTIRSTYVRGSSAYGQSAIAREFGVDRTIIGRIVRRESWAHVS